ncbi:MAG: CDP-glycerol glycerophosphotransferase family protein, partial [Clostridia bacterium]|nr:CDP-glycerol glycerophosphotransferase family protein [Clostridia bacterium]
DICSIPLELFGNASGEHILNYKYREGTRVVDLSCNENMDCIQLSFASAFIRATVAQKIIFDTSLYHAEDAKVVLEILMNNTKLGLIAETAYHYRKQGNSTIDKMKNNKRSYSTYIKNFSVWALDSAQEHFGFVPKFIQFTVMYDLQWKITQDQIPMGLFSPEEEEAYRKLLFSVSSRIDDDVILAQKNLGLTYKCFTVAEKYGTFPVCSYEKVGKSADGIPVCDCMLKYSETAQIDLSELGSGFEFAAFHHADNAITLEGYHVIPGFFSSEDIRPSLLVNEHVVECEQTARKNIDLSIGRIIAWRMGFRATIPLNEKGLSVQMALIMDGKLIPVTTPQCGQFFPLSHVYKYMRAYSGGWMMALSDGVLNITKQPALIGRFSREISLLSEIWKENLLGGRKAVFGRLLYHLVKPFKRKKLWIVSDRIMKADDNGEALFRYLMKHKPSNTRILFAINKRSPDAKRMAAIGPCVDAMSFRHKFLHLLCDVNISSQADNVTLNPYSGHSDAFQNLLVQSQFVFLQHGVIKDDLSGWLNRYEKNLSGFITTARPEYYSIVNGEYAYKADNIWLTGLPRFDLLYHREEKKITLMPTWRRYLMASLDGRTSVWNPKDDFEDSGYYQFYTGLLNSNKLLDALESKGYTLQFFPHPNLRLSGIQFRHDSRVEVLSTDVSYRDIYATSSLVLTDYSSAVFDFAYLRKPIIYCQFDREEFFSGEHMYTKGYFDYERDGFGEVEYDLDSTIDRIIEYVGNDCKLKPMYRDRIDSFFAYSDQNNCQRVVEKILALQSI